MWQAQRAWRQCHHAEQQQWQPEWPQQEQRPSQFQHWHQHGQSQPQPQHWQQHWQPTHWQPQHRQEPQPHWQQQPPQQWDGNYYGNLATFDQQPQLSYHDDLELHQRNAEWEAKVRFSHHVVFLTSQVFLTAPHVSGGATARAAKRRGPYGLRYVLTACVLRQVDGRGGGDEGTSGPHSDRFSVPVCRACTRAR